MAATGNEAVTLAQLKSAQGGSRVETIIKPMGEKNVSIELGNGCYVTVTADGSSYYALAEFEISENSVRILKAGYLNNTTSMLRATVTPPSGTNFSTKYANGTAIGVMISAASNANVELKNNVITLVLASKGAAVIVMPMIEFE